MAYDTYETVKKIYGLKNSGINNKIPGSMSEEQKRQKKILQQGYADNVSSVAQTPSAQSKQPAAPPIHATQSVQSATQKPVSAKPAVSGVAGGLSQAEINNLLSTGTTAGTAAGVGNYAGQDLYSQYDRRQNNYYNYFDDAWNMQNAGSQGIADKSNQYWDILTGDHDDMGNRYSRLEDFNYSNPFETEQGRSVLERYDLAALQGRDNQAAAGGAGNSGNIDSYSAANALRQQASLRNLGEQSALAAHSRTVNDGRGILGDRGSYLQGVYDNMLGSMNFDANQNAANTARYTDLLNSYSGNTQQLFDNDQTALNSQVERDRIIAEYSGMIPSNVMSYIFGQVDERGNVRNMDRNYMDEINKIDELLKTADPETAKSLNSMKQALMYTRDSKILTDPARYGMYAGQASQIPAAVATPTAAVSQAMLNSADYRYGVDSTSADNRYLADVDYNKTKYVTDSGENVSLASLKNDLTMHTNELKSLEDRAQWDNQSKLDLANIDKEVKLAIADIEKIMNDSSISSNEKIELEKIRRQYNNLDAQLTEEIRQFDNTMEYNTWYAGLQGDGSAESAEQRDITGRDITGKEVTFARQSAWENELGETVTPNENIVERDRNLVQKEYNRILNDYGNGIDVSEEDVLSSINWLIQSGVSADNPLLVYFWQWAYKNMLNPAG